MSQQLESSDRLSLTGGWEGEIYRHWNFPPEVIHSWRRLVRDYGDAGIFLSDGWFENWWNSFGEQEGLLVLVLKKENEVKAIIPCRLASDSKGGRERILVGSMTNDHTCHYDLLVDNDVREEALAKSLIALGQITSEDEILLNYLNFDSGNVGLLLSAVHSERMPAYFHHGPWAPWVQLPSNWDQFVNALPGRLRNTLKRCRKKAEAKGKLDFEVVRESEQLNKRLDELFQIEHRSWKGQEGTAIKSNAKVEEFYRTLAHWAMGEHSLLIFFLKLDGLPIAGSLCLTNGKTVFLLKPGYDERYAMFSPGSLLQAEVLKYLSTVPGIAYYNFLGACDSWKMEWTMTSGEVGSVRIFPKSLKGWTQYFLQYGWKNLLKKSSAFQLFKQKMHPTTTYKGA